MDTAYRREEIISSSQASKQLGEVLNQVNRIVYEIQRQRLIVLIVGIGKRERAEIYREVARRLRRST